MDWVHCNKCLKALISNKDIRLYITTCGCIFCDKCLGEFKDKQFKCCICGKMAQATKLGSTMPPEIADFFKEPMEVLSSLITVAVSKASRIVEFQKKHRTRLTKAHSMQMEKMRSFYEEYKKLQGLIAELSKEKEILQRKCAAYENEIKNYQNGGATIFRHPNTASPMAGPIPQHKFEFLLSQSSQGDGSDTQTPRLTMPRFGKMTPTNDKNFSTPASSSTMSSLAFRVNQNLAVSSSGGFLTPVPSDPSPQSGRPTGSSITAFLKALSGKS